MATINPTVNASRSITPPPEGNEDTGTGETKQVTIQDPKQKASSRKPL